MSGSTRSTVSNLWEVLPAIPPAPKVCMNAWSEAVTEMLLTSRALYRALSSVRNCNSFPLLLSWGPSSLPLHRINSNAGLLQRISCVNRPSHQRCMMTSSLWVCLWSATTYKKDVLPVWDAVALLALPLQIRWAVHVSKGAAAAERVFTVHNWTARPN